MKKAKKRVSSGTLILKALTKNDKMKSRDLRQIAFDNKTDASHYNGKVKKVPQGWWCVGISDLRGGGMMEQDDNGLYSITELGKLNIDKPFTKNPIMPKKIYTQKINDLRNRLHEYWNKSSKAEYQNSRLMEENEKLLHENDILKSELDKYKKTEEIKFLDDLVDVYTDVADDLDEDSWRVDILNRIIGRLKK